MFTEEDGEPDVWPSFVDLLSGAVMFLLVALVALLMVSRNLNGQLTRAVHTADRIKSMKVDCDREEQEAARNRVGQVRRDLQEVVTRGASTTESGCTQGAGRDLWLVTCIFSADLTFARNEALLTEPGRQRLSEFSEKVMELDLKGELESVIVEGHTDSSSAPGDPFFNWELSSRRAGVVVKALISSWSLTSNTGSRFQAIGLAEYHPRGGEAPPGAEARARWQRFVAIKVHVSGSPLVACQERASQLGPRAE